MMYTLFNVFNVQFMVYSHREDHQHRVAQGCQLGQTLQQHFLHILYSDTSDRTLVQKP